MRREFVRGAGPTEPTPWAWGLAVAIAQLVFSAGVLLGIFTLVQTFNAVAALAAVLIVAVGLASTLWELRTQPVWRWITWGTVIGSTVGVFAAAVLAFSAR